MPLDFCKTTACPVAAGPITIGYGYVLPSVAPPGAYSIELKAKTNTGAELFCFDANFRVNFFLNEKLQMEPPVDAAAWEKLSAAFAEVAVL